MQAAKNNSPNMHKEFLSEVLFLNSNSNPKPAFVESPEINAPKVNIFFKYNITIITEVPQFGIKPIVADNMICINLFALKREFIAFAKYVKPVVKMQFIISIKAKIYRVCLIGCMKSFVNEECTSL